MNGIRTFRAVVLLGRVLRLLSVGPLAMYDNMACDESKENKDT